MVDRWNYCLLSSVCEEITSGGAAPQGDKYFINGKYPFVRVVDMGNLPGQKYMLQTRDLLNDVGAEKLRLFPSGTILFTKSGASLLLNQRAILKVPMYVVSHIGCLIPNEAIISEWLYYWMKTVDFNIYAHATTLPSLKLTTIKELRIPVPTIPEQERIVAWIEELFSQLDAGVETLKKTKAQLAVYRQAVLKEAFEGNLSAEWRTDHSDCSPARDYESIAIKDPTYKDTSGDENEIRLALPDNWIKLRMGDVFSVEVGATPSRRVPEYWNGAINWVSSGEVRFNRIFSTDERITEAGLANSSTNVQPAGTIMLAMIGEGKTRGQAAILEISAAHNQNTAAILVSATPCDSKYIYYFLQMNYENTRRVGSGNNQKALNKERVRALRFPFTSFAEQHVIVEAIESRLSVCDSIEQTVDIALQQAEAMRQSILKDAFEGKL